MNRITQIFAFCLLLLPMIAMAQPYNEGPKKCKECHEEEYDIWKKTKHFKAFKDVHKKPEAKDILKVVGGGKTMKKNEICSTCHYTKFAKAEGKKVKSKAGPSCESCHGPSSAYRKIHNDFGGKDIKAKDEAADHRKKRQDDAKNAGMIWSFMHFDVAMNCMSCHGLARTDIDGEVLGKMMAAKHPAKAEFELVKYSQGTVRHRFYPPDQKKNAKMTQAEMSRLFVVGQAAVLVSADMAEKAGTDDAYKAFQKGRADKARENLAAVVGKVPEVQALLDSPSEAAGRKVADAVKDMDLSAEVGGMLPKKFK